MITCLYYKAHLEDAWTPKEGTDYKQQKHQMQLELKKVLGMSEKLRVKRSTETVTWATITMTGQKLRSLCVLGCKGKRTHKLKSGESPETKL